MGTPRNLMRQAARERGDIKYQGVPCIRGHSGVRYTAGNWCVACASVVARRNAEAHRAEWERFGRLDIGVTQKDARERGLLHYFGVPCIAGHRVRFASCRACVDCATESSRERRTSDPDAANKYHRDWRCRNPEKASAKVRRWRLKNPSKTAAIIKHTWHMRRARKKNAPGSHTPAEAKAILVAQGGRCAYCGTTEKMSLDHKTPLSRGGSNYADNLQWLCQSDNSRKKDRTDAEARRHLGIPDRTPWDAMVCEAVGE